jgi:hypothetical protein
MKMKIPTNLHKTILAASVFAAVALAFIAGAWAQAVATQNKIVWRWPDSMDSVNAAPKNHKLLFENDHVRLLEVTVQPGETENMHGHKYPSVFMMDAPQPRIVNKDLEENAGDANRPRPPRNDGPAQFPTCRAMTSPQAPHQVTNTDTFPQHFYRMEFKKIDGDAIREMKKYPGN